MNAYARFTVRFVIIRARARQSFLCARSFFIVLLLYRSFFTIVNVIIILYNVTAAEWSMSLPPHSYITRKTWCCVERWIFFIIIEKQNDCLSSFFFFGEICECPKQVYECGKHHIYINFFQNFASNLSFSERHALISAWQMISHLRVIYKVLKLEYNHFILLFRIFFIWYMRALSTSARYMSKIVHLHFYQWYEILWIVFF